MPKSGLTVIFTIVNTYFVYFLTNKRFTVLYVGVTSDLEQRVYEHKTKFHPDSFTAKYQCNRLVYYEEFSDVEEAIKREKQLKRYKTAWKVNLINQMNSEWKDLSEGWYDPKSIELGINLNRQGD
jgi:putative endonuclease